MTIATQQSLLCLDRSEEVLLALKSFLQPWSRGAVPCQQTGNQGTGQCAFSRCHPPTTRPCSSSENLCLIGKPPPFPIKKKKFKNKQCPLCHHSKLTWTEPTVFQQRTHRTRPQPHPGRRTGQGSQRSLLTAVQADPTTKASAGPGLGARGFLLIPSWGSKRKKFNTRLLPPSLRDLV